ncbi:NAD(P)/FAD-dependent oxidoreductase [Bordetella muralis]|jgi:glycine/D-amino acid oxidase-like deaminating enzyme|uniref:NAD(P)/FAD-dependent oxidoreductase n=1 Tax=Bordetella muralis TaxID=1649130 RepID=UPI0039EF557F
MQNLTLNPAITSSTTSQLVEHDTRHSLWLATANATPALPVLDASRRADVIVVGGGYLGLACALQLASHGVDVTVLEAATPGFGASGRNGGQVIPGLKYDPAELTSLFGPAQAENIIAFASATADAVFDTVARYNIQCDAIRQGWIQGAHNDSMLRTTEQRARQWIARGANAQLLDGPAITQMIGCAPGLYRGGWIDRRAGSVHPLNYALGLASAAIEQGAHVFQQSAATRIERDGRDWRVITQQGASVSAPQIVLATNAYTDELWPRLRTSIVPAVSSQVATDPLPTQLRSLILQEQQVVSDARRLLHYYRVDAAGRLIIGGRGNQPSRQGVQDYQHIRRALEATFPQLTGVSLPYRWSGRLAMTRDSMPHLHQPAPGITIALGCNGRGVGLTTAIGQAIADHLRLDNGAALPFSVTPIRPIPLHKLHRLYIAVAVQYFKIRDLF